MDYRMPLYVQLQDIIIKRIEEKKYLPGEAIPSERKMAEIYGVNRMTVKRAVNKLVETGYLYRKQGAGTFVADRNKKKIDLNYESEEGNVGISAIFREKGIVLSNKVLGTGEFPGGRYLCYKLGLEPDQLIWGIHRVRMGDSMHYAIEYTYVPKDMFDDIDKFDFSQVSLYDYMESKEHLPIHFSQELTICNANEKIAELLQIKKGTAIFKIEYLGADERYNIVEYTKTYINPEVAEFSFMAMAEGYK